MFDVFPGTADRYVQFDQHLRSLTLGSFVVRPTSTHFADSSFTVAGPASPAASNSLLIHTWKIDSHSVFCRHLKTYLFLLLVDCNVITRQLCCATDWDTQLYFTNFI